MELAGGSQQAPRRKKRRKRIRLCKGLIRGANRRMPVRHG